MAPKKLRIPTVLMWTALGSASASAACTSVPGAACTDCADSSTRDALAEAAAPVDATADSEAAVEDDGSSAEAAVDAPADAPDDGSDADQDAPGPPPDIDA
jgi:hypothetical protein